MCVCVRVFACEGGRWLSGGGKGRGNVQYALYKSRGYRCSHWLESVFSYCCCCRCLLRFVLPLSACATLHLCCACCCCCRCCCSSLTCDVRALLLISFINRQKKRVDQKPQRLLPKAAAILRAPLTDSLSHSLSRSLSLIHSLSHLLKDCLLLANKSWGFLTLSTASKLCGAVGGRNLLEGCLDPMHTLGETLGRLFIYCVFFDASICYQQTYKPIFIPRKNIPCIRNKVILLFIYTLSHGLLILTRSF